MVDPSEKTEVIAGDARLVQRIGRYRLERRLGAGGMAEVFLARAEGPLGFEKQVVIKRIRPQLLAQPRFVEMFLREARMLAGLDHPNIVRIIELDEQNGEYFLALEYLEGLSLREVAERHWSAGRSLPIEPIITIVADAALGLEHAHNYRDQTGQPANLVHRDVSPDNLFVTTSGTVKVIDFGIAKRDGLDQLTQNGELKGKVPFMAPEHLNGLTLDARADLFSLGVVLYWLLTGRRPFDGVTDIHTMKAILEDPPRAPRALNPKLPSVLEEITLSLLEKNRDRRMKSAGLLHDALMSLVVGLPRGAPQPADLVGFAQRVPASEHEIVPAGIAAAPSLSWPMTPIGTLNDNSDDDAAAPTRIGFVPPPAVASSRAAPRTHESIPRLRVSDTEEGGYQAPATELIEKQSAIDVSTDEHKRSHPSGPSSSSNAPIIDVERVSADITGQPTQQMQPVIITQEPPEASPTSPGRLPPPPPPLSELSDTDAPLPPLSSSSDPFPSLFPPQEGTVPSLGATSELPIAVMPRSHALPIAAGIVVALGLAGAAAWFSGFARGVVETTALVDAGAPAIVVPPPAVPDAGTVVVDAGDLGAADAGTADDAGDSDGPQPTQPTGPHARTHVVSLAAPPSVQWEGPNGEKYGAGNRTIRLPDSPRVITAIDGKRGGHSKIVVDARMARVEYAKLPKQLLQVRARPFAEVFLGKERLGITPLEPIEVVVGSYDIRFVYKKVTRVEHVDVKALKPASVNVVMAKTSP